IFELRNHFYNTMTFLMMLQQKGGPQLGGSAFYINSILPNWFLLGTPTYYAISIVPFWLFFFSWIFVKIGKYKYGIFLVSIFLIVYGYFALIQIFNPPMNEWNYEDL